MCATIHCRPSSSSPGDDPVDHALQAHPPASRPPPSARRPIISRSAPPSFLEQPQEHLMSDLPFRHPGPSPEPQANGPATQAPHPVPRNLHVSGGAAAETTRPAAALLAGDADSVDGVGASPAAGVGTGVIHFGVRVVWEEAARRAAAEEARRDAGRLERRARVAKELERTPAEDVASAAADGRTSQSSLLTM